MKTKTKYNTEPYIKDPQLFDWQNVTAMLEHRVGPGRLSRMGVTIKSRWESRYIAYTTAIDLYVAGIVTEDDLKVVNHHDLVYFICKEFVETFVKSFDTENHKLKPKMMDLFHLLFDKDRDAEKILSNLYYTAVDIQDWFFDNGFVTDSVISKYEYQSSSWTGAHFTQCKFMLWRKGIISFDNSEWRRKINIAYLSSEELKYYLPIIIQSKNLNYKEVFDGVFESGYGDKYATSAAFYNFKEYQKINGFIEVIPSEFLIAKCYSKEYNSDVFNTLLKSKSIEPQNIEFLTVKYNKAIKSDISLKKIKRRLENKRTIVEYQNIQELFTNNGIITKRREKYWNGNDRFTFFVDVDGYEHSMYVMKDSHSSFEFDLHGPFDTDEPANSYAEQVNSESADHFEMLLKYKDTVHKEYDRLNKLGFKITHVMEGGGSQMQAFFCSDESYVSIMYLGFKNQPPTKKWTCHMQSRYQETIEDGDKDPFGPSTFYHGKTEQSDIKRYIRSAHNNIKTFHTIH